MINGRWKLRIPFELFGGSVRRFSELERAIPEVTQKMLAQQLRQLEKDGLAARRVHPTDLAEPIPLPRARHAARVGLGRAVANRR